MLKEFWKARKGKGILKHIGCKWEDNTKMVLREMDSFGYGDRFFFVNTVMKVRRTCDCLLLNNFALLIVKLTNTIFHRF